MPMDPRWGIRVAVQTSGHITWSQKDFPPLQEANWLVYKPAQVWELGEGQWPCNLVAQIRSVNTTTRKFLLLNVKENVSGVLIYFILRDIMLNKLSARISWVKPFWLLVHLCLLFTTVTVISFIMIFGLHLASTTLKNREQQGEPQLPQRSIWFASIDSCEKYSHKPRGLLIILCEVWGFWALLPALLFFLSRQ